MLKRNNVLETVKESEIKILNLGQNLENKLKENGFKTVLDLFIEEYGQGISEEEISIIKLERDNFIDMVKKSPDICNYNLIIDLVVGLDSRTINGLKRAKINTLGELKDRAKKGELKMIRNIGEKSYQKIIKVLENYSKL